MSCKSEEASSKRIQSDAEVDNASENCLHENTEAFLKRPLPKNKEKLHILLLDLRGSKGRSSGKIKIHFELKEIFIS